MNKCDYIYYIYTYIYNYYKNSGEENNFLLKICRDTRVRSFELVCDTEVGYQYLIKPLEPTLLKAWSPKYNNQIKKVCQWASLRVNGAWGQWQRYRITDGGVDIVYLKSQFEKYKFFQIYISKNDVYLFKSTVKL